MFSVVLGVVLAQNDNFLVPLWCNRSTVFVLMFSRLCKVFSLFYHVLLTEFLRKFYI